MKTTFIQIGSRLIPIPFWLWLAIIRIQKKYSDVKIWALRRLGIVYDFEGGRTPRAADGAGTLPESGEYLIEYLESNVVRLTPRR